MNVIGAELQHAALKTYKTRPIDTTNSDAEMMMTTATNDGEDGDGDARALAPNASVSHAINQSARERA